MFNFVFANEGKPLGEIGGLGPLGTFDIGQAVGPAVVLFNQVISNIVGVITVIAGIWFIFQFIIGAFSWLTAGGDKAKVQTAQGKMTHAIIGLATVIIAIFIIDLIGTLLGLDVLRPGKFVVDLWQ